MPDLDTPFMFVHTALLRASYRHWTGRDLVAPYHSADEAVSALFEAPYAVLSHGTQHDPLFTYGNRLALELFEMEWEAFTALPSRLSAEPVDRQERRRLLARVASDGYVHDYAGVRVSRTGRRFAIRGATLWNLIDADGRYRGQGALIREWDHLPRGETRNGPPGD